MGGAVITWKSDKPNIIGNDGIGTTKVKVTATLKKGSKSVKKLVEYL